MRYRKKPVVIEATQWFKNGDHPEDYSKDVDGLENGQVKTFSGAFRREAGWEGSVVRYFRRPDVSGDTPCKHCGVIMHDHGWIDTLEGGHIVCPGDFIITGVKGEVYPCKPDIFKATYELMPCFYLDGGACANIGVKAVEVSEEFCLKCKVIKQVN